MARRCAGDEPVSCDDQGGVVMTASEPGCHSHRNADTFFVVVEHIHARRPANAQTI